MKAKVLIIDDDEELSAMMAHMLKSAGYETAYASDGQSGLEKAHTWRPDACIVDLLMPGIHGFTVCERLRKDADLKGLRILVASSKPFDNDIQAAMEVGADDYLVKPFKKARLIEKMKTILDGKGTA